MTDGPRRPPPFDVQWKIRAVGQPGERACFGCKRSRVQISAARPNSSKTYRHQPFGLAVWSPTGVQKWTPGAPLPCTKRKAARFLSTSLILEKPAIPDIFPLSD